MSNFPIFDNYLNHLGEFVPFSKQMLDDKPLLEAMCSWRNSNLKFFLDQKPSTIESTIRYFENVISNESQNMFFMTDVHGDFVGHFGFKQISGSVAELDNLVRSPTSLMTDYVKFAELALINEVFKRGYSDIRLRVFSSNVLARRIHEDLGFKLIETVKLKIVRSPDGFLRFKEISDNLAAERYLMLYSLSELEHRKNLVKLIL